MPPIKPGEKAADAEPRFGRARHLEYRDYLAAQRQSQRPVIRTMSAIATFVLVGYLLVSLPTMPARSLADLIYATLLMMLALGCTWLMTYTRLYLTTWWVELPFFTAIYVAQLNLNTVFFQTSHAFGSSPVIIVSITSVVLLFTAAVAFTGSRVSFPLFAAIAAVLCTAFLTGQGVMLDAQLVRIMPFYATLALSIYANHVIERNKGRAFEAHAALAAQGQKTEELLFNVLPEAIARRLKEGATIADAFGEVSVVFIDIVGFSALAKTLSPRHLVDVLNGFFSRTDRCAEQANIEKVKTIGDAYLAIAGATLPVENCAVTAIRFSQAVAASLADYASETGLDLKIRIGIHTGSVVGGVIGDARKAYDYWGETMNIASRIQGTAEPNTIHVSQATYFRARAEVEFGPGSEVQLKGIGQTTTYAVA